MKTRIRSILKGLSLTSAMFVFQACYGTPQDFGYDTLIEGKVTSQTSGLPIKGIKVSIRDNMSYETTQKGSMQDYISYEITNDEGEFIIFSPKDSYVTVLFEDVDSTENGSFKDTYKVLDKLDDNIFLDVIMTEK